MRAFTVCFLRTFVAAVFFAISCQAHPGHSTAAEAEWKESKKQDGSGKIEIALRMPVRELELALSSGKAKRMRFGHSPDFEKSTWLYLRERFFAFRTRKSVESRAQQKWIGMEVDKESGGTAIWCYFELAIPDRDSDRGSWSWRNRLFIKMFEDQANSIRLRVGEKLLARDFGAKVDTLDVFEKAGK